MPRAKMHISQLGDSILGTQRVPSPDRKSGLGDTE